jgi:hypothetical protein
MRSAPKPRAGILKPYQYVKLPSGTFNTPKLSSKSKRTLESRGARLSLWTRLEPRADICLSISGFVV